MWCFHRLWEGVTLPFDIRGRGIEAVVTEERVGAVALGGLSLRRRERGLTIGPPALILDLRRWRKHIEQAAKSA